MAAVWMQHDERSNLLALKAIAWVARRLGRWPARLLLYPITLYFVLFGGAARRASLAYLRRALGREPRFADGCRHVFSFASTILDRFFLLNDRFDLYDVQVHGEAAVRAALEPGRGVFMIGAHLGSFEVVRATSQGHGAASVSMVMYEENARKINQILQAINPALQADIIPLGRVDSMLRVKHALERGDLVGMLCDRSLGGESVRRVPFLGREAEFPTGPFRLAAMLKRPLVLMVGLYRGGNRYEVHFETLADFSPGAAPEDTRPVAARVDAVVDAYVARLEHHCRSAPYNWFNFYDYWGEDAAPGSVQRVKS